MKVPLPAAPDNTGRVLRRDVSMTTAALLLVNGTFVAAAALSVPKLLPDLPEPEEDAPARRATKGKTTPAETELSAAMSTSATPAVPVEEARSGASSSISSSGLARGFTPVDQGFEVADSAFFDGGDWFPGLRGGGAAGAQLGPGRPYAGGHTSSGNASGGEKTPDRDNQAEKPSSTGNMTVRLGGDDNDVVQGNGDNDYILGRNGNDLLTGGAGNDRLLGGKGDDVLLGGPGRDLLVGDKGDDTLSGGLGSDTFVFRSGYGDDLIVDFNAYGEHDVIEVAKSDFANFAALSASLTDTPYGAMLTLHDGSTLTLNHVAKSSLTAGDFHFEV